MSVEEAADSLLAAADDGSSDIDVEDTPVINGTPVVNGTPITTSNDEDEDEAVTSSNAWEDIAQYANRTLNPTDQAKLRAVIDLAKGQYEGEGHADDFFAFFKEKEARKQEERRKAQLAQPSQLLNNNNNYSSPYATSSPPSFSTFAPILASKRPGPQPRNPQPPLDTVLTRVHPQKTSLAQPHPNASAIQRRQIILNCAPRAKRRTLHGIMGKGEVINHHPSFTIDEILRDHPLALKGGTLLAIREELVKQRAGRGWGQLLLEKYEAVYGADTGMKVNSIYKATGMAQQMEREDEEAHAAAGRKKRCLRCFEKRVRCSIREEGGGVPCRECCAEGSDPWCFVPQDDLPVAQTTPITNQPISQPTRFMRATPPNMPKRPSPLAMAESAHEEMPPEPVPAGEVEVAVKREPVLRAEQDNDGSSVFETADEGEGGKTDATDTTSPDAMDVDKPVRQGQVVAT